jgi:hypothetical protein
MEWIQKAADQGYEEAIKELEELQQLINNEPTLLALCE